MNNWNYILGKTTEKPKHDKDGEANGNSKLTNEIILEIRKHTISKQNELAKRFGVHRSTIARIIQRKVWTHI